MKTNKNNVTRRNFLKAGAAISAGTILSSKAFAAGSDTMRVALIGCGSRGTKDAIDCLMSDNRVEMIAMADMFDAMTTNRCYKEACTAFDCLDLLKEKMLRQECDRNLFEKFVGIFYPAKH